MMKHTGLIYVRFIPVLYSYLQHMGGTPGSRQERSEGQRNLDCSRNNLGSQLSPLIYKSYATDSEIEKRLSQSSPC